MRLKRRFAACRPMRSTGWAATVKGVSRSSNTGSSSNPTERHHPAPEAGRSAGRAARQGTAGCWHRRSRWAGQLSPSTAEQSLPQAERALHANGILHTALKHGQPRPSGVRRVVAAQQAVAARGSCRAAGDHPDMTVAMANEMLHQGARTLAVVDQDRVERIALDCPVDQDSGDSGLASSSSGSSWATDGTAITRRRSRRSSGSGSAAPAPSSSVLHSSTAWPCLAATLSTARAIEAKNGFSTSEITSPIASARWRRRALAARLPRYPSATALRRTRSATSGLTPSGAGQGPRHRRSRHTRMPGDVRVSRPVHD